MNNGRDMWRTEIFTDSLMDLMNRQSAQSRKEAQHTAALTAFDSHRSVKIPTRATVVTKIFPQTYTSETQTSLLQIDPMIQTLLFKQWSFGPHQGSIQPNQTGQVWKHSDTLDCRSVATWMFARDIDFSQICS